MSLVVLAARAGLGRSGALRYTRGNRKRHWGTNVPVGAMIDEEEELFTGQQPARDDQQFADVYAELRNIARREHRRNPSATLHTTALVHEAWLKLRSRDAGWNDHDHFLSVAALAMRHVLVDYARYRAAERRDDASEVPLIESAIPAPTTAERLLAVDSALDELAGFDPRLARLVMLRFFGGLTMDEAARCLNTSPRSAARDWVRARAYLRTVLDE